MKFSPGRAANTLIEAFYSKNPKVFEEVGTLSEDEQRRLRTIMTMLKMKEYLLRQGFQSFQLKVADKTYYDWTLPRRIEFLGTLTPLHLCKSMIMENKKYDPEYAR